MNDDRNEELRVAIRELLAEELARLRGAPVAQTRVEPVSLRNDAELAAFVKRLGTLHADAAARADIEAGRHVFRLAGSAPPVAGARGSGEAASFERVLVSERDVQALDPAIRRVRVTRKTRFTPLAKDALRRRGITIERSPS